VERERKREKWVRLGPYMEWEQGISKAMLGLIFIVFNKKNNIYDIIKCVISCVNMLCAWSNKRKLN